VPKRPFVLIICDGWGISPNIEGNAIAAAETPLLDALFKEWPNTTVEASGKTVGLPAGQMGNSEVGHLTIGSGRVVWQPLGRQFEAIETGEIYQNKVLLEAIETAKKREKALHILGLVSPGGVHSHHSGALAVARMARQLGHHDIHVHAFTDGRDTPPTSAIEHIREFESELAGIGAGKITSLAGRYYAMDRDGRWERVSQAYEALVGHEYPIISSARKYIEESYARGETDEFLRPIRVAKHPKKSARIDDGDVAVFFNFRPDRARQLSYALVDRNFNAFERSRVVKDLHLVSFTEYDKALGVPVVFPNEDVNNSLAEVISKRGLKQYHVAETEKYAHVTYFFNGGREESFPGETRNMIPSLKVPTYDLSPEMSAPDIANDAIRQIEDGGYDFIVINFANADMVGHTGNFEATVKAIEVLDECISKVIDATLRAGGVTLMTADHGNAEKEVDLVTGQPITAHTTSKVPVLLCGTDVVSLREGGALSDIAPTILELMDIAKPHEMTGESLIEKRRS
jgi:2,3-bisphosphoglycerate-independent phosphoglycerate mutase